MRFLAAALIAFAAAAALPKIARADEGGVGMWVPGFFGSLAATPLQPHAVAPHDANGLQILVVDDNQDGAEMLAAALRLHGCDVLVAHDGPAALRIAASHKFAAALLDIGLPVMDGYELAQHLREMDGLSATKLIAVTGYGQDSDRERALAAGFEQHLVKPVEFATLETLVTSLLQPRHI